tara:strand:+ start:3018 stop:3245 length:228 start_codon:yes stop_codon:yes gene_type:complete
MNWERWLDWRLDKQVVQEQDEDDILPMVRALNRLEAEIRRSNYKKMMSFGKKNFNMVKKIQKTAEDLEKIVGKMK